MVVVYSVMCVLLMNVVNGSVNLRGPNPDVSLIGSMNDPLSFLSISQRLQTSNGIDWWQWVLIAGLLVAALVVTVAFRKPGDGGLAEKRVILTAKVKFCSQLQSKSILHKSQPLVDPVQLGLTIKGKTASGEFLELFYEISAHDLDGGKFNWEEPEFEWIIPQPSAIVPGTSWEIFLSLEQYSPTGGLVAVIASGILPVNPPQADAPMTGIVTQTIELISTSGGASLWGSMDFTTQWAAEEDNMEQFNVAQKQIWKKLKIVRPLFLAAHSLAIVLVIIDSFFGIRFLFGGCLASSVQSLVNAGLIALLSIPMAAEWGQMHYGLSTWVVRVGKLNSQFKATLLLLCAVPQIIISVQTGEKSCQPVFTLAGALAFVDCILFSVLFVQSEASGHWGALIHFNCFKRPLPPPTVKEQTPLLSKQAADSRQPVASNEVANSSPTSYAARRGKREAVQRD